MALPQTNVPMTTPNIPVPPTDTTELANLNIQPESILSGTPEPLQVDKVPESTTDTQPPAQPIEQPATQQPAQQPEQLQTEEKKESESGGGLLDTLMGAIRNTTDTNQLPTDQPTTETATDPTINKTTPGAPAQMPTVAAEQPTPAEPTPQPSFMQSLMGQTTTDVTPEAPAPAPAPTQAPTVTPSEPTPQPSIMQSLMGQTDTPQVPAPAQVPPATPEQPTPQPSFMQPLMGQTTADVTPEAPAPTQAPTIATEQPTPLPTDQSSFGLSQVTPPAYAQPTPTPTFDVSQPTPLPVDQSLFGVSQPTPPAPPAPPAPPVPMSTGTQLPESAVGDVAPTPSLPPTVNMLDETPQPFDTDYEPDVPPFMVEDSDDDIPVEYDDDVLYSDDDDSTISDDEEDTEQYPASEDDKVHEHVMNGAMEKLTKGEIFEGDEPLIQPYDILPWWGWAIVFFLLGAAFIVVLYFLFYQPSETPEPDHPVAPIPAPVQPQPVQMPDASRKMYCLIGEDQGRKVVIRVSDPSLCRRTVLLTDEEYENSL